jgi:ATP:cob(I)alamin adenosyltransferase
MKIYTKTGDLGETGLLGGVRVRKDHPRIEAYGTVDELNAVLGVARATGLPAGIDASIARIQHELFELGAELARPTPLAADKIRIDAAAIGALEGEIDQAEARLEPLRQFILPGGAPSAAALHLARERSAVRAGAACQLRNGNARRPLGAAVTRTPALQPVDPRGSGGKFAHPKSWRQAGLRLTLRLF